MARIQGKIILLDVFGEFISEKNYKSKSDRQKYIDKWIKMYALKEKNYTLIIIPNE